MCKRIFKFEPQFSSYWQNIKFSRYCPKFHIFTNIAIFQVYLQLFRPTASSLWILWQGNVRNTLFHFCQLPPVKRYQIARIFYICLECVQCLECWKTVLSCVMMRRKTLIGLIFIILLALMKLASFCINIFCKALCRQTATDLLMSCQSKVTCNLVQCEIDQWDISRTVIASFLSQVPNSIQDVNHRHLSWRKSARVLLSV